MRRVLLMYMIILFLGVSSSVKISSESLAKESHFNSTINSSHVEKSLSKKYFFASNKEVENQKTSWKLIFHEEFNEGKDLTHTWNVIDSPEDFNGRKQYYSPSNIQVANGHLEIITRKEKFRNKNYTSAAMTTQDKFSFKYGKVEIRAKLPKGKGIFPAFWMLPVNGDAYPEIDMMELLGQQPNQIWNVVHYLKGSQHAREYKNIQTSFDFNEDYHIFSLEWTPTKITWLLDGKPTFSTTEYSPNVDMYLYINTAVGGVWATDPDDTNSFPQIMKIDYIRVYAEKREKRE